MASVSILVHVVGVIYSNANNSYYVLHVYENAIFKTALVLDLVDSIDSTTSLCKSVGSKAMLPITLIPIPCSFSLSLLIRKKS
jgi:hypothetical protein